MANDLKGQPWIIDTAGGTLLYEGWIHISAMDWGGYSDAAHKCVVEDGFGKQVWQADGSTDLTSQESHDLGWIRGLKVTTLGSGKLTIWVQ